MEYYYGWGLLFWPIFFLIIIWAFALWPIQIYHRRYYGYYPYPYSPDGSGLYRWNQQAKYYGKGPRNYRRSDERIMEDVSDSLLLSADVDASNIEVQVDNGVVTLSGHVNSRKEKRIAEWISESVSGVQNVENKLTHEAAKHNEA